MPFQIVTGPDGKPTVQLDKPVYKGPETAVPPSPNPLGGAITGASKALTQMSESIPSVVPGLSAGNLKAGIGAGIAGVQKLIETGDPYKALDVAGKAIRTEIEKPQNVGQKVIYSGVRDLAQSALVNLPQSASRKPGQADSPIPGYGKPFPSFKLNPYEQVASTLIQAALAVRFTRGAIAPIAARATAIPGVASVAQKIQTTATALKATGMAGRTAVGIAKASSEGAVTGAIAEGVGFTPGKDPSLVQITKVLDDLVGTSLHQPLRDLIVSKGGNNSDVEARWLAAAADATVIGPAFGTTIAATGFVLRAAARKAARSAATATPPSTPPGGPAATPPAKPTPSGKPAATPPAAPPVTTAADQALKDYQSGRRQEVQAKKDMLGSKPDSKVDKAAARNWQKQSNKYERELKIIEQQEIAEQNARLQEKATNLSPAQSVDDPWLDDIDVDGEIDFYGKQLDDALTEAAKGPQPPAGSVAGAEPRTAVQPMGSVAAAGIEPPTARPTAESYTSRLNYSDINPAAGPLNASGKQYAEALAGQDPAVVEATSQKLRAAFDDAAAKLGIKLGPNAASQSWSMHDIGKQLYMNANPTKSGDKYFLGDPLTDVQVQSDIVDRMLGFEISQGVDSKGNLLPSSVLTSLGRNTRGRAKVELDLAPTSTAAVKASAAEEIVDNVIAAVAPPKAEAATQAQTPGPATRDASGFALPDELSRSAPGYNYGSKGFKLRFASDYDKAAYILANDAVKASKAAPKFRDALEQAGFDVAEAVAYGQKVRAAIKAIAKDAKPGVISLPDQGGSFPVFRSRGPELPELPESKKTFGIDYDNAREEIAARVEKIKALIEEQELNMSVDTATTRAIAEELTKDIKRVAGNDVAIRFNNAFVVEKEGNEAWGYQPGQSMTVGGEYDFITDTITINNLELTVGQVKKENLFQYLVKQLTQTGFHEPVHRLQYNFMTAKELRVLTSFIGKLKIDLATMNYDIKNIEEGLGPIKLIEKIALASQQYSWARKKGLDPRKVLIGYTDGRLASKGITSEIESAGLAVLDSFFDFSEKMINWANGNDFISVKSIFEDAYNGKIAARKKLPNVLEEAKAGNFERFDLLDSMSRDYPDTRRAGENLPPLRSNAEGPRPPDEDEAQRIARLTEENKQALIDGDITQEDIYRLNTYQRGVSRSGATSYTTKAEELSPLVAAMSEIKGGTEARTGIQSFTVEEVSKINQDWINAYGLDWDLNYSSFAALDEGMKSYELGSLNRAMTMLDEAHVIAGKEAGMWLNNIGMDDATALERLNSLVTALGTVTERSVVIDRIRRRWGQLGKEMQIPRNYDIPDQPTGVVQAAVKEEVENFNATTPDKLIINDPQLQGVLDGSVEMSEEAMAKIDVIAQTMADASVGPKKARMQFYTDVSGGGGGGGGGNIVPTIDAFRMYYINSLISGPDTVRVNLYNAMFNYSRLVLSQVAGHAAHLDFERMLYSGNMFLDAFSRIPKAFELAGHAGKLGKSLYSQRNVLDGGLGNTTAEIQAIADARQAPVEMQDDSLVNNLISKEELAETSWAKLVNHLWRGLGTPFTRFSITADTFSSSIAGYSYERMLHMSRGMDLAVENGLTRMSPEAWKSATDYSVARANLAMKDAVVNGKTISNALLQSPYAQRFIDSVNFTDDVAVQLEPRSAVEGYRIGKAKKLEGEELDKYVESYLAGGTGVRPLAEQMMEGKVPLGTVASIPGEIFEKAYTEPLFPNVPGTLPYQKLAMTFAQAMYKTPLNIVKNAIKALPGPNAFVDLYWRDITSADVNTQRRAEGEILVATASLGMLLATAAGGYVRFNGSGPLDPQLKQAWLKDRQMQNSMQVWNPTTGTWFAPISLNAFGPLNIPLGVVADYIDMADRSTPAQQDRIGSLLNFELLRLASFGIINQTYFSGISNIYNAIFDTTELSRYGNDQNGAYRWLQRILPNLIPNSRMLKAVAKEIDPVLRRVNPAQPEEGFMGPARELLDNVAGNTPGYSKQLPPQLDWSLPGAPPILLPQYVGQGIISADAPWLSGALVFTPLPLGKVGREITDPVQKELNMLYNAGGIPNKVFAGPRAGDFGEGVFLSPVDFAAYIKLFASIKDPDTQKIWHQTVSEMIETPGYLSLPIKIPASNDVSVRAVHIQAAIEKFKTLAKAEFGRNNFKVQNAIRAKQERTRDTEFIQEYGTPGFLQQPSKPTGLPQFTEALR